MSNYYYGLTSEENGVQAIQRACLLLPNSKSAYVLLLATAKVETDFGQYRDTTIDCAGEGWFQFDPDKAEETRDEMIRRYKQHVEKYRDEYDFHIEFIAHGMLRYASEASAIMARLKYWLVNRKMPHWSDANGMWLYYKDHFNSWKGATTEKKFKEAYLWALIMMEKYPIEGGM